jgi:hypothetical protein
MNINIKRVMEFAIQKPFCEIAYRQEHFHIAPDGIICKTKDFDFFVHSFLSWRALRSAAADR